MTKNVQTYLWICALILCAFGAMAKGIISAIFVGLGVIVCLGIIFYNRLTDPTDYSQPQQGPYKFTVIWGNIGSSSEKRLDHVTVDTPTFTAIMDAAFQIVYTQWNDPDDLKYNDPEFIWDDLRHKTPYDGYAILDGHVTNSQHATFG